MHYFAISRKRLVSLFMMLLVAVSTQAINTFTVNTTNPNETGAEGNSGSFLDAVKKIKETGGSWTIEFATSGVIEAGDQTNIKLENIDELNLVGNKDVKLTVPSIFFSNIASFSMENMNLINEEGEEGKNGCSIYLRGLSSDNNSCHCKYIKNCNFDNVGLIIGKESSCDLISNCKFWYTKGADQTRITKRIIIAEGPIKKIEETSFANGLVGCNPALACESIENCTFTNSALSTTGGNGASIESISNCTFSDETKLLNAISAYSIGSIYNCTFEGYESALYGTNVQNVNSCKMSNCWAGLSSVASELVDLCTFTFTPSEDEDSQYAILKSTITAVDSCTFMGTVISEGKISKISNCSFSPISSQYCIQFTDKDFSDYVIEKNTFDFNSNGNPFCAVYLSKAGLLSQNLFFTPTNKNVNPIKCDITAPTISSVVVQNGKYKIKGTANTGAQIELFLSNGSQASAVQYLTKVNTKDDLTFEAEISEKDLKYDYTCFIATATYDNHTSCLSKPVCAQEIPELEAEGDVIDNTCSTPNSKVSIRVTGWTDECVATLNGKIEQPATINNDIALFEFYGLNGGNYEFEAINEEYAIKTAFPFQLTTIEEPDLSKLTTELDVKLPECYAEPDGWIFVDFAGNESGLNLEFSIKGIGIEQTETTTKVKGNLSFMDLPSGNYEVFVNVVNADCPSPKKSLGKINIPSIKKLMMDEDNMIVKGANCETGYGSIFLPILNYIDEDQVTIYHVVNGEAHGKYGYHYASKKKNGVYDQMYYTDETTEENGHYDKVFLECTLLIPGKYWVVTTQCNMNDTLEFEIKDYKSIDLSGLEATASGFRQPGEELGKIQIRHTGISEELKFTVKNATFEKSITTSFSSGYVLFHDVPAGEYEVFVQAERDNCPDSEKSLGKVVVPDAEQTGVKTLNNDDELVDVFDILGIRLKKQVNRSSALDGLKKGVYIVGNKRVVKTENK